jgi:hypothetical protein
MVVGKAKNNQNKDRQDCRTMIQAGLGMSVYDIFGAKTKVLLQKIFLNSRIIPRPTPK